MRRLSERQRDVLTFIVNLTVVLGFHLEEHFGPEVRYDLKKLKAMGLARPRRIAGMFNLWQATPAGCHLAGVSVARARQLGGQAIHQKMAVGHLVTMLGYQLLSRERAIAILHDAPPSVSFVLGSKGDESVLFRVLTPSSYAEARAATRSIRKLEEDCDWSSFNENERGYLVTTDSRARKKALTAALKQAKLYGRGFVVRIELAPSAATLQEFIHAGTTEAEN